MKSVHSPSIKTESRKASSASTPTHGKTGQKHQASINSTIGLDGRVQATGDITDFTVMSLNKGDGKRALAYSITSAMINVFQPCIVCLQETSTPEYFQQRSGQTSDMRTELRSFFVCIYSF